MWGFFLITKQVFMFLLMPVNGFHHGYIKALFFKTDQSTINIEHSL